MKITVALFFALASCPACVAACSLGLSGPFKPGADHGSAENPVPVQLTAVELNPNIGVSEEDSCWGVGFAAVTLTGRPFRKLKKQGYLVRPLTGVNDPGLFPSGALAPQLIKRGTLTLTWGWTGVTPDPDGHLRWRFEVVPVSPAGVEGEPLQVCVATDDSCPPREGHGIETGRSVQADAIAGDGSLLSGQPWRRTRPGPDAADGLSEAPADPKENST